MASKDDELEETIARRGLDFIFICETWARPGTRPPGENYIYWGPVDAEPRHGHAPYGTALIVGPRIDRGKLKITEGHRGHTLWWTYGDTTFGGIYLSPGLDTEECQRRLTIPESIGRASNLVLIGDFNMRLGALTGDKVVSERGRDLLPWLLEQGLTLCSNITNQPTFTRTGPTAGTSMVDMVWTNLGEDQWAETITEDDIGGSEHRMIFTEVILQMEQTNGSKNDGMVEKLALLRLKDPETREAYQQAVRIRCGQMEWTRTQQAPARGRERLDEMNASIQTILMEAAREVLGNRKPRRKGTQLLRDAELREAKAARRQAWRRLREEETERTRNEYKAARSRQAEATTKAKERIFQEFADRVDKMEATELSKVISAMAKRQRRGASIPLPSDERSMQAYAAHFAKQFARQDFHGEAMPRMQELEQEAQLPFTVQEMATLVHWLPRGKAPGASGLPNELIREAPMEMLERIWDLFRECWELGMVPEEWTRAIIHPVPKKGDLSQISNHRPISLTENLRKLFEKCLMRPITAILDHQMDVAQGGFRARRSTLEQVACLQEAIIQRKKALGRPPLVAYLDIKAAYDTVDRSLLWPTLHERGVRGRLLRTVMALFEDNRSQVAVQGCKSPTLRHEVGLLQGSILSPILYATHIDELAGRLRTKTSIKLGKHSIAGLLYADDLAVVADTAEQLTDLLQICQAFSEERRFRFAPTKCEIVAAAEVDTGQCKLYGEPLKRSTNFSYLGVTLNAHGIDATGQVMRLCAKATEATNLLRRIGFNAGGFAMAVKGRMYQTFIRPKLEYGLQLVKPNAKEMQMLERTQLHALRTMCSVGRSTSGAALLELAGLESMEQRWQLLNAAWTIRTEGLGEQYMVHAGWAAHGQRKLRNSSFGHASKNPTMAAYRSATIWAGEGRVEPKRRKQILRELGKREQEKERWERRARKATQVAHIRRDAGREIDRVQSKGARRLLVLWLLRRLVGRPEWCKRCLRGKATYQHVQECVEKDVDGAVKAGRWRVAALWLAEISEECLGRSGRARVEKELKEEEEDGEGDDGGDGSGRVGSSSERSSSERSRSERSRSERSRSERSGTRSRTLPAAPPTDSPTAGLASRSSDRPVQRRPNSRGRTWGAHAYWRVHLRPP